MKVNEIFYSIDGEGKRAGELTIFIRLFGCLLNCSYCDTRYSCVGTDEDIDYKEMSIEEIIEECKKYDTNNITVTGGEPLIHKDIKYLLRALNDEGYDVNVETSGSVDISPYYNEVADTIHINGTHFTHKDGYENVWFTIDYKSPSSNMEDRMVLDNFKNKYEDVLYKFVVGDNIDLMKAYEVITKHILPTNKKEYNNYIYLSPIFGKIEPKSIVAFIQKHKMYSSIVPIRIQLQIHKFIWDVNKRGV